MKQIVLALSLIMVAGVVSADMVSPFTDVVVNNSAADNVFVETLTWNGTAYDGGQLVYGETTRWSLHPTHRRPDKLWIEGDAPEDWMPTVGGTSTPKAGDVGSHADNNLWVSDAGADISSIDGIDYQETLFVEPVTTIFVFERGGNDNGVIQAILMDDSLGEELALVKNGLPYGPIGNYTGQTDTGYVFESTVPVKGIRITASGHDSLMIATTPEPGTLALFGLAGLMLVARRRRR